MTANNQRRDPKEGAEAKESISIRIDSDVLARLREEAALSGIGYQTRINQILREACFDEKSSLLTRLREIEKKLQR